jgi:lipopolysaccharide/colanic/teichoic acid biosynthesis glycosyltransferase
VWPTDGQGVWVKRAVDVAGAVAGLVLFSPVLLAIALFIRLDSPGPVLFRQARRGQRGQPFWMLKFQTMVADAGSGSATWRRATNPRAACCSSWETTRESRG